MIDMQSAGRSANGRTLHGSPISQQVQSTRSALRVLGAPYSGIDLSTGAYCFLHEGRHTFHAGIVVREKYYENVEMAAFLHGGGKQTAPIAEGGAQLER